MTEQAKAMLDSAVLRVLVPAFNEAETIGDVLEKTTRLGPMVKEVIVVVYCFAVLCIDGQLDFIFVLKFWLYADQVAIQ